MDRVGSRQREYGTREWSQGAEKMCIAIAGSRSIGEYEIPLQSFIPTPLCPLPLLSLFLYLCFSLFFFCSFSVSLRHLGKTRGSPRLMFALQDVRVTPQYGTSECQIVAITSS